MKKTILLLVFSIALSSSLFAQQDVDKKVEAYITRVESKITLTSEEKATLISLNTEHAKAGLEINDTYEKGSEELKAKRKENNKRYGKALKEAFGKERAKEIKMAAKKNKKGKKKKKKN